MEPRSNGFTEDTFMKILPNPKDLVQKLDQYIIGNEKTKETLALMAFRRGLRLLQLHDDFQCETALEKNNVLLIGNTGSGKTAIIRALTEILEIPIPIVDVTTYTSAGWHGDDLQSALKKYTDEWVQWGLASSVLEEIPAESQSEMIQTCAEYGIIYFDEIDKIRVRDPSSSSAGRDINGTSLQQELLQYFEGGKIPVDKKHIFDTTNMTCIAGGAFVGLKEIILKRTQKEEQIGFNGVLKEKKDHLEALEECTTEDLISYGFIPELLGRIHHVCSLKPTTKGMLFKMLTESKNSPLKQYEQLFSKFGIKVSIEKRGMNKLIDKAFALGTGGRALKGIVHNIFDQYLYNFYDLNPGTELKISAKDIKA